MDTGRGDAAGATRNSKGARTRQGRRPASAQVAVVAAAPSRAGPAVDALVENYLLAACAALIPTRPSTFFSVAAVRASAREDVRAVVACPQAAAQASPFDGRPVPCLFEPTCPAAGAALPPAQSRPPRPSRRGRDHALIAVTQVRARKCRRLQAPLRGAPTADRRASDVNFPDCSRDWPCDCSRLLARREFHWCSSPLTARSSPD